MTEHTVAHASFTLERTYDAPPARVFHAFADPATKARWFGGEADEAWADVEHTLDFRVGGRESSRGRIVGGPAHLFECRYADIVQDRRIVYTYDMRLDDRPISASVATIELEPQGAGTRLVLTEQTVHLDGIDDTASRESGTRDLLDALAAELAGQPAGA